MNRELEQNLSNWLRSTQDGDAVAYSRFLNEVSMLLRSYFKKRVFDTNTIEDLAQETLLSIHQARHTYLPDRPFGPWFYAIARYRMVDFFRKQKKAEKIESLNHDEDAALMDFHVAEELMDRALPIEKLTSALALLPEKQRITIELHKLEGLSFKEIALRLGISEAAAKVNAHRGYQSLKIFFEGQNEN